MLSGMLPTVSICIPTYNQAELLPAAVESALAQDYADLEVVISENHSTDGTASYLAGLRNARLRIVKPERHLPMSENWKYCVDSSRGRYFAILSSDDVLLPGFAQKLTALLEAHGDAAFAYCAVETINLRGEHVGFGRHIGGHFFRSGKAEIRRYLMNGPRALLAGILFSRRAYHAAGGLRSWNLFGDWDLEVRLLQVGGVAYRDEILARYRIWDSEERNGRFRAVLEEACRIYEETMADLLRTWPDLAGAVASARRARARSLAVAAGEWAEKPEFSEVAGLVQRIHDSNGIRFLLLLGRWRLFPLMRIGLQLKSALRQKVMALLYAS